MPVAQTAISPVTKPKGKQVFIAPKPKQETGQNGKEPKTTSPEKQDAQNAQAQTQAGEAVAATQMDQLPIADQQSAVDKADTEIERTNTDPKKDPGFIAAVAHSKSAAAQQAAHEPVDKKVKEAKDAGHLAENEQQATNSAVEHFETIDAVSKQERPPITAEGFLTKFETFLTEIQVPQSEEAAKKFKKDKPITKLNDKVNSTVSSEKEAVTGGLETTAKAEAPASTKPTNPVTELPATNQLAQPTNIKAKAAAPKPKTDAEISMQRQSATLDDEMRNNNVTEEQLANSNEPTFLEGLESKKTAQKKAKEAPQEYRKQEAATLQQATGLQSALGAGGLQAMNAINTRQNIGVTEAQTQNKNSAQATKARISAGLTAIYTGAKTRVTTILDALAKSVTEKLDKVIEAAYKVFERNIEDRLDGWLMRGLKKVGSWLGLSDEPENPESVFRSEKAKFETEVKKALRFIAQEVAKKLNEALDEIKKGKKEVDDYFNNLSEEEKKLGQDAYDNINDKYTDLENAVYEKQDELAKGLADTYHKSVGKLREKYEEIKKRVESNWLTGALAMIKGVIETIKKLRDLINNLLAVIASVIDVIMNDPIAFMGNLFSGIKMGFQNFVSNIKKHIIGGLLQWLTGTLGPMGITLPENIFSLSGIFSLVMQVLGLGWDTVRRRAVKIIPEPALEVLEKSFEVFNLIRTKGIAGIWEFLKDKFTDLKEVVLDAIQELVTMTIIEAGVKWLLSLLIPGAGFVKAIMAIKDVIVFFVESAVALLPAVIEGILGLASGSIALVAKSIEMGIAKIIPIFISLMAKLLGIGGLAKRVTKIIGKIRKRIDRQIDKMIRKAQQKAKKMFGKKKKGKGKKKNKKKKKDAKLKDTEVGEEVKFKAGKESHRIWFKKTSGKPKLMMASTPTTMDKKIIEWKADAKDHAKKKTIDPIISTIESKTKALGTKAIEANNLFKLIRQKPDPVKAKKAGTKDDDIEKEEKALKNEIVKLLGHLHSGKDIEEKAGDLISAKYEAGFYSAKITEINKSSVHFKFVSDTLKERKRRLSRGEYLEALKTKEIKKGGEGEHTEYKPVFTKMEFVKGGVKLHYKYKDEKHKEKTFTTLIEFTTEAKSKEFKVTASAKKTKIKEEGTRGKTDSHGAIVDDSTKSKIDAAPVVVPKDMTDTAKIAKLKNQGHAAHLVADWFSGSGYKSAKNTVPTSDTYNTGTMGDVEKDIYQAYNKSDEPFDLTVTATQTLIDDSSIMKALKEEKAKVGNKEIELPKSDHGKILGILKQKEDPQYTKSVNYKYSTSKTIGEDEKMKSWLGV